MPKIISITSTYDAAEDRIHIATRLDDKAKMCLWLTHRLARRLVRVLAEHMEKAEKAKPEAIPLASVRNEMMAQEQAQAVSSIKPRPPVRPERDAPVHLVNNIGLRLAADTIELRFDSSSDCSPKAVLDTTQARQWLSMLHRQFVTAEWPLDVWPIWLTEAAPQAIAGATRH